MHFTAPKPRISGMSSWEYLELYVWARNSNFTKEVIYVDIMACQTEPTGEMFMKLRFMW